jgi:hypothetical protein
VRVAKEDVRVVTLYGGIRKEREFLTDTVQIESLL